MHRLMINRSVLLALATCLLVPALLFAQNDNGGGGGGNGNGGGGRPDFGGRGGGFRGRGGRGGFRQRFGMPGMPGSETPNPNAPPTANPTDANPGAAKPGDAQKKPDDKPTVPKVETGPPPVIRPPAYDNPALYRDQRLTVDDKRMVRSFNFQDAPWQFVLEELARISGMSLDWQQLPGDSLNLRTNVDHTVVQARDIINEHLLARGYSILVDPKTATMSVVNLDTVNTALVPRVAPEDLARLQPHELVKVSFRLDWMLADQAAIEFKSVLSPKARLLALKTTNRLEAVDAVENLRQLAEILDEEQGQGGGDRLVKEFDLRYTRAPEVLEQLQAFLGVKKDATATANPQEAQRQMFMQQRMAMQQMMMGQSPGQPATAAPPRAEIRLMANQRRNTILVNAPPDQMAIIKQTIYKLDVPPDRSPQAGSGQSMQVYRLATADPEVVVNFLDAVGDLDPQTKLDVDKKNRAVVAFANAHDQKQIAALVKNLDGSDRKLKVIQLHGLDASLVAGTLRTLLAGDEQTKTNDNNSNNFAFPFGFGRRGGGGRGFGWSNPTPATNTEEVVTGKFRVDADAANNRLILWANKIELEQVEACLAELGEIASPKSRTSDNVRVLDFGNGGDEQQFLERLRRVWPALGKDGTKLIIDVPEKKAGKDEDKQQGTMEPQKEQPAPKESPKPAAAPTKSAVSRGADAPSGSGPRAENSAARNAIPVHLAALTRTTPPADRVLADAGTAREANATATETTPAPQRFMRRRRAASPVPLPTAAPAAAAAPSAATDNASPAAADKPASNDPVYITRSPDGKLIIASRNSEALDALEKLAARIGPPRKDYSVFTLHYATAASVRFNLEEFFATERTGEYRRSDSSGSSGGTVSPGLSQRRPLRFLDDMQTNSILVQGASGDQLRQIGDLIDMYDRPEQPNSKASRMTKIFPIVHSRAALIAETLKDVFRDLLSANDKALEGSNGGGRSSQGRPMRSFLDAAEDEARINQGRFKGQLSLGVDETSNRLIVSCPESLMRNIEKIIEDLDKAAAPVETTFQVLRIDRNIDASVVQKKLMEMLKKPGTASDLQSPNGQASPQQQQQQGPQRQRGGNGGGGGGGRGRGGQMPAESTTSNN